jgi:cyclophilin family peptidyl-prolyl cis-trans isomerase
MASTSFLVRYVSDHEARLQITIYSGEVVSGMDVVKKMEAVGSQSGKVSQPVVIAKSGVV